VDPPGSTGKLTKMQQRVAAGMSPFANGDGQRDVD
jgi:hypothetical protein